MNPLSAIASAILVGGTLSAGLLCLLAALPRWRAASLSVRIAPYVRDVVDDDAMPRGLLPAAGVLPLGGGSRWQRAQHGFERMLGGGESVRLRLAQAGAPTDPIAFRGRQLSWLLAGIAAGAVTVIALALAGRMSVPVVVIPILFGALAAVGYDMQLSARARSRRARLTDELPTTLEFLALCLSAGEGFLDSLRRVAAVGSGELTAELRRVVLAAGTGSPLADALGEMSTRLQLPGLSRAVDQVIAALEHGAPLASVLHAQAGDAREDAKRTLIEQAGRKEILMLLPLVFLILPLSVVFAIYPGLFILRLGIG
ncbi:type II secretion system F family protein [Microbacterium sp. SA39]|uniref:type II secretion system F family protein n=1 Tax=Microbacterium sp. SA39 TaxID=1263625 RepID=UPI0005FA2501|nr:type II secretion system F family protein [Microbacterium sp. SA39]KJQ54592.1 Bacterial type II secretion system protein F domain protein [Microbacterium sp. SA39]